MNKATKDAIKRSKTIFKRCHCCGKVNESKKEPTRCTKCHKPFLPSNYFGKIHAKNTQEFNELFSSSDQLSDADLIVGVTVLWED